MDFLWFGCKGLPNVSETTLKLMGKGSHETTTKQSKTKTCADDYETINIAYIVRGILNKNMLKGIGRD